MTVSAILALIRDIAIAIALGFIVYRVYTDGANSVKVNDLKALKAQLDDNSKQVAQWAQDAQHAQTQRTQDMATVSAAIASHSAPIVVMRDRPANSGPVSGVAVPAGAQPAGGGTTDAGARSDPVDVRPFISAFEERYEGFLADCRAEHAQWPKVTP